MCICMCSSSDGPMMMVVATVDSNNVFSFTDKLNIGAALLVEQPVVEIHQRRNSLLRQTRCHQHLEFGEHPWSDVQTERHHRELGV